jgi:acetyl-CoA carboxylase biotin carboxyl carrier protein
MTTDKNAEKALINAEAETKLKALKGSKINELTHLMELMEKFGVTDLEICEGEHSVSLSRGQAVVHAAPTIQYAPSAAQAPALAAVAPTPQNNEQTSSQITGHALRSPMVGTVYLSPSPEADDFVKVGQTVAVGDVMCLVEAMKMFNQIESDKAGVVKACLVKSGEPVEFDHPLFIIE